MGGGSVDSSRGTFRIRDGRMSFQKAMQYETLLEQTKDGTGTIPSGTSPSRVVVRQTSRYPGYRRPTRENCGTASRVLQETLTESTFLAG